MVGPMTQSWEAIIEALGDTGAVADALAQSMSTVSGWKTRGIPAPHWAGVVRLAASCERSDITLETLAGLAARKLDCAESEARA